MKNTVVYIILAVILSSCSMSNNFNSQKFTELKKIKPAKTEASVLSQSNNDQIASEGFSEGNHNEQTFAEGAPESNFTEVFSDLILTENNLENEKGLERGKIKSESPENTNHQINNDDDLTKEQEEETKKFVGMVVLFFLAAIASAFFFVPAIPFYIGAFILAILLRKRIKAIAPEEQTVKQKRHKSFAFWVLIQPIIGLLIAGVIALALDVF